MQLAAQIPEGEDQATAGGEARGNAGEHAREIFRSLEVGQRVAHAHDGIDAAWDERGDVTDVSRDRVDGQASCPRLQLGQELGDLRIEVAEQRE